MGSDSIFSSSRSEQRWVEQITKCFENEMVININDCPVSIFNVPKSISDFKPEAYVPQFIALGPYHHARKDLYQLERYKLAAAKSFLSPSQIHNFQEHVIAKLKQLEPMIRACYHKYLDLDDDTLAWIMAIDGLFLLNILQNYSDKSCSLVRKLTQDAILYRDVMVLENQVPFILLKELRKTLQFSSPNDIDEDDELSFMLRGFCQAHSPLKLAKTTHILPQTTTSCLHLLDFMYHLIVNRRSTSRPLISQMVEVKKSEVVIEIKEEGEDFVHNIEEIIEVGMKFGIGKKVLKPVNVIQNMPWDKISNLLGLKASDQKSEENKIPLVEEIKIPNVSRLYNIGGIQFSHTIGGIRDIKFVEEEGTLYLPIIKLNVHSEVVLRNLVAYELATASETSLELSEYVDLMSGIIDTKEDVRLLKEKGIIRGDLGDEEIANLFNGMNKSSGKGSNETIEKINKYYNKRPVVQAKQFIKKNVVSSWKLLTLVSTVLVLFMLTVHTICQDYGCPRIFE